MVEPYDEGSNIISHIYPFDKQGYLSKVMATGSIPSRAKDVYSLDSQSTNSTIEFLKVVLHLKTLNSEN
jgi:hypothetical protein